MHASWVLLIAVQQCLLGRVWCLLQEAIAEYWKGKPGELASRWTKFAGISGERGIGHSRLLCG